MNKKEKPDNKIKILETRTPKKKIPSSDPFARIHLHPLEELEAREDTPTLPESGVVDPTLPQSTLDNHSIPYPTLPQTTTSPIRDFTKVPNSTTRKAIPDGKFRGQSKHTYDVLYSKTRGAIIPKRTVQLTKSELVKATGLEIKTIQRHLGFLEEEGLIHRDPKQGDHKGPIYEVFIYEETLPESTLVQSGAVYPSTVGTGAESIPESGIEDTTLGQGLTQQNKGENDFPNTFFNTNTKNDDEAFKKFNKISRKHTGKDSTYEDFLTFMDLMLNEVDIAASKTSVSTMAAFAAKIVEKKIRAYEPKKGTETKSDTVGKPREFNFESWMNDLRAMIIEDKIDVDEVIKGIDEYQITEDEKARLKSAISREFK